MSPCSFAEMTATAWGFDDDKRRVINCVADGVVVLHQNSLEKIQLGEKAATPDDDKSAGEQLEWRTHVCLSDHGALFRVSTFRQGEDQLGGRGKPGFDIDCAERLRGLQAKVPSLLKY